MLFEYRALQDGKVVTAEYEAPDANSIALYLKSQGSIPLQIKVKTKSQLSFLDLIFNRVTQQEIENFTHQLSLMLNAGLTLIDALEIIKKQTKKITFKNLIDDISLQISNGKNFSQAIEKYPHQFSHLYIALIKSGEASGKLDMILDRISVTLEKQREFRSKAKGALIYPLIIVIAGALMMFVLLTFVVPKLLDMIKQFNVDLPPTTKLLITITDFFSHFWIVMVISAIIISQLFKRFVTTPQGALIVDKLLLKIPQIGSIIRMSNLVDSMATLSTLIGSGVPILESLQITAEATSNQVFHNAVKNVYSKVEQGIGIGDAFAAENVFPETLVQMVMVGEQTGKLEITLGKIANYYQLETEESIKSVITLIEPVVLGVLGIAVGFVIFSIITPIYSLTSTIR